MLGRYRYAQAYEGIFHAEFYMRDAAFGFGFYAAEYVALQNVGQSIIYRMREEVFTHIHSLSVGFLYAACSESW